MAEWLKVTAGELRPFDVIGEGETICMLWFSNDDVEAHVGVLRTVERETGIADPPSLLEPVWEDLHQRRFHYEDDVTIIRGLMPPRAVRPHSGRQEASDG